MMTKKQITTYVLALMVTMVLSPPSRIHLKLLRIARESMQAMM